MDCAHTKLCTNRKEDWCKDQAGRCHIHKGTNYQKNDIDQEQDDKFVDALFAMAAAYKKLGDYHKSLEYLEKLLEIEPQAVNARALKKLILQKYMV